MKIVFVLQEDIRDKRTWSGVPYYLLKSLEKEFETVEVISPIPKKIKHKLSVQLFHLTNKFTKICSGKFRYNYDYSDSLLKYYSNYIDAELSKINYDIVISSSIFPFYFSSLNKPLIQITDGTPKLLFENYFGKVMSDNLLSRLEEISLKVVDKSTAVISSSQWCAESIINDYHIPGDKVYVLPFGANVEDEEIKNKEREINKNNKINLLFIGADWKRKGAELSVKVCDLLISSGFNINLTIVGCDVPEQYKRDYINSILYLDKNVGEDKIQLTKLFDEAHFFIMPSAADMSPIVLCDAAAYGLPVITKNVGGISDIVVDNLTGIVLGKESGEEEYCKRISELIANPELYRKMCLESRKRFEELLNWNCFAKNLKSICNNLLNHNE